MMQPQDLTSIRGLVEEVRKIRACHDGYQRANRRIYNTLGLFLTVVIIFLITMSWLMMRESRSAVEKGTASDTKSPQ
jgi:hypothetical protein